MATLGGGFFVLGGPGKDLSGGEPLPLLTKAPIPPAPPRDDFGPEVKGLRAKVTLAKEKFAVGETIPVTYVVKNISKNEQTLMHSTFFANHLIVVKDAVGKEPPLSEFGGECRRSFSPGGERKKNVGVRVPARGEEPAYYPQYDLTKLYDLSKLGRYTVQYVYEEKTGYVAWKGQLPSNEAAFEIVGRADGHSGPSIVFDNQPELGIPREAESQKVKLTAQEELLAKDWPAHFHFQDLTAGTIKTVRIRYFNTKSWATEEQARDYVAAFLAHKSLPVYGFSQPWSQDVGVPEVECLIDFTDQHRKELLDENRPCREGRLLLWYTECCYRDATGRWWFVGLFDHFHRYHPKGNRDLAKKPQSR